MSIELGNLVRCHNPDCGGGVVGMKDGRALARAIPCPEDRCDFTAAYCGKCGGLLAAKARIAAHHGRCWGRLAPRTSLLATAAAVFEAGYRHLDSRATFVNVVPVEGGRFVATLGANGRAQAAARGSFTSEAAALGAGVAAWRRWVGEEVAAIRAARGGTLGWGVEVHAPEQPVLRRCLGEGRYEVAAGVTPVEGVVGSTKKDRRRLARAALAQDFGASDVAGRAKPGTSFLDTMASVRGDVERAGGNVDVDDWLQTLDAPGAPGDALPQGGDGGPP